jgi:hypothetical protein
MKQYRHNLPPVPERIKALPVSDKGYPIPYFVAYIDGVPDFRIVDERKLFLALSLRKCWVCGQHLGAHVAFVGGTLIVVNRISAEPPSHVDCAEFAVKACPFLLLPESRRRQAGMAELPTKPVGGVSLDDNPGVAAVCVVKGSQYTPKKQNGGLVIGLGEIERVDWYKGGQPATRADVVEAMDTAIAKVMAMVPVPATEYDKMLLDARRREALTYLPDQ